MVYVMYLFTCYASAHTVILSELFCRAHVSAEARARSRCSPVEWRPLAQSQPNLGRGGRPRWAPASDSGLGMLDTFSQITVDSSYIMETLEYGCYLLSVCTN